jgi:GNAT superfamily N-acetyltransferase
VAGGVFGLGELPRIDEAYEHLCNVWAAGDRVIGAVAYAPTSRENADFCIAVAHTHREEQVGRTLLATLLRHARRVGVPQLAAEMLWSNRPMQMLAMSMGFAVEPLARDRTLRRLVLSLK